MRKLSILIVILILMGLVGATPYVAGYQFKKNFLEVMESFSQNKNLKWEVVEYKQGWLSSDAQIRITVPMKTGSRLAAGSDDKDSALIETIDSHILHGPLIKDPNTNQYGLAMAGIQSKISLHIPGASLDSNHSPLAQVNTLVDFKNHWHNELLQTPLTLSFPELGKFSFQGSTGKIDFDYNDGLLDHLNIATESKGLVFIPQTTVAIQEIDLDSLSYTSQASQEAPGQWIGDSKLVLPKLSIKKADNSIIAVQNIELTHSAKNPEPRLFGFKVRLAIKNIQTANEILPSLGPLQLDFAVNNLNAEGLQKLSAFLREPHNKPLSPEDRETYLKLVLSTITPSSSFTETLSTSTALGDLKNDANISWKGDQSTALTQESLMTGVKAILNIHAASTLVDKLIAARDEETAQKTATSPDTSGTSTPAQNPKDSPKPATTNISASAAVNAVSTPPAPENNAPPTFRQTFDGWIQQGYISKEGDTYVVSLVFEKGATTVNGKALTP